MKIPPVAVVGIFLLLYILPLGVRPMFIPDEFRYAEISREMVETGDWIVPHLNGLRYFEKPVLGYWLHALSIKLLGANSFAIRLPSALAVGLSALILFLLIRRFTKEIPIALLAASVFLTCLEVYGVGTFCVLDSIFSLFTTASIVAFFFAFTETRQSKRTLYLIGSGISCGLAFLTKGFLAFTIPVIVIIPFAVWQHRPGELLRVFWVPVITAVLTGLPWSFIIHIREPDFWNYFFWVEHVNRFISPNREQHSYPLWFFIPVILVGTLPWTFRIGMAIYRLKKIQHKDPLFCFAICWFVSPFLFFSFCQGKLPTYILPCFPPLIVLFIIGLRQEWKFAKAERFNHSDKTGLVLIIVLMIGLIVTQIVIPDAKIYRSNETWKWFFLIIGFLTYIVLLIQAGSAKNYTRAFTFSCLAPFLLMFSAHFILPDRLIEQKTPTKFLKQYKDRVNQNTILISDNNLTAAVCWNYKRSDVFLLINPGEFKYGLEYDDALEGRLLDIDRLRELITESVSGEHAVLVTGTERYIEYKCLLPEPIFEIQDNGFVFAEYDAGKI